MITMENKTCREKQSLTVIFVSLSLLLIGITAQNAFADSVISTIPVGKNPIGVGVDPDTNKILVASASYPDDLVYVINGTTDNIEMKIKARGIPSDVAVDPTTNLIYVLTNFGFDVIDGATYTLIDGGGGGRYGTFCGFATPCNPDWVDVNPVMHQVYVANENTVYAIKEGSNYCNLLSPKEICHSGVITMEHWINGIRVNPITNKIYATNGNVTSVIDGTTNNITSTINVGNGPSGVGVNPVTNKIYVANSLDNTTSVIDGLTNSVIDTIKVGNHPIGVNVNPVTNKIYVTNYLDSTVSVIDGSNNSIIATIKVKSGPLLVGINSATNRIYVTNYLDSTVSVIDGNSTPPASISFNSSNGTTTLSTNATLSAGNATTSVNSTISISGLPQLPSIPLPSIIPNQTSPAVVATIPVGYNPWAVGVNPNTNRIYVANAMDNDLSVINGSTDSVIGTIPASSQPYSVGVNPNTNTIYVTGNWDQPISIINGSTGSVTYVTIPTAEASIAINPNTNKIYFGGFNPMVMDGTTKSVKSLSSPCGYIMDITVNPVTNKIYGSCLNGLQFPAIPQIGTDTCGSAIIIFDGSTDSYAGRMCLGPYAYAGPITENPATNMIYVGDLQHNIVYVINGNVDLLTNVIPVFGSTGWAGSIAVNTNTNRIYDSNPTLGPCEGSCSGTGSGVVTVIDGVTNKAIDIIKVGNLPNGIGVNPVTNKVYVVNVLDNATSVISDKSLLP